MGFRGFFDDCPRQSQLASKIERMVLIKCSIICVLRLNQQQQPHHHSHHNQQHHPQHHQQPPPQNPEDHHIRMNHQIYPQQPKGGMMAAGKVIPNGKGNEIVAGGPGMYPQKGTQFRKYNGPSATTAATGTRVDYKPKVSPVQQQQPPVMDNSHIPTVSANGIPGAAETTVTTLRPPPQSSSSATSSVPNGTILSNSASDEKDGGLNGMLGKEKTAMCLVNELSRYNKVCVIAFAFGDHTLDRHLTYMSHFLLPS